ncbi:MAG: AI-2E family transporter [Candidatus Pacebacteria bacterium]|jgi:predicted PurR-regulated permease PerM|nr:AI-2E family transporter [Candidatus Paceibacterota bacterium]
MKSTTIHQPFFYGVLLILLAIAFFIFRPLFVPLFLAGIIAVVSQPLYRWYVRQIRSATVSSLVTVLSVAVIIGIPLAFIATELFKESKVLFALLSNSAPETYINQIETALAPFAKEFPDITARADEYIRTVAVFVSNHLGTIFANTAQLFFQIFIILIALFYFLRDGGMFKRLIVSLSPLPDDKDRTIYEHMKSAIRGVVVGSLMIAIIQGTLVGIGFWIFGIANPVLWGSIAVLAALIPTVGTALVLAPAIVFLFLSGQLGGAVGLLVWGVLMVGLIDNLFAPTLIGKKTHMHPFFVFLGVIGGLSFFGPIGFFAGPLTISLLFAFLEIYRPGATEGARSH